MTEPKELVTALKFLATVLDGYSSFEFLNEHVDPNKQCKECALAAAFAMSHEITYGQLQSLCCAKLRSCFEKINKVRGLMPELNEFMDKLEAKYLT